MVKPPFTKRFKIREADVDRGIGARVFNLRRRTGDPIREFVARATELSYQCTDEQMAGLRYRLYAHMAVPEGHADFESDRRIQAVPQKFTFYSLILEPTRKYPKDNILRDLRYTYAHTHTCLVLLLSCCFRATWKPRKASGVTRVYPHLNRSVYRGQQLQEYYLLQNFAVPKVDSCKPGQTHGSLRPWMCLDIKGNVAVFRAPAKCRQGYSKQVPRKQHERR